MPKRIEGVSKRILESAKIEFLEKGFLGASLRTIAENAQTSTRSIYTRFSSKEDLFNSLVSPIAIEFKKMLHIGHFVYWKNSNYIKTGRIIDLHTEKGYVELMEYIYDHLEEFKLLIIHSQGTSYSNFINELVTIDYKYTLKFADTENQLENKINKQLFYSLSQLFYSGMFDPVIHNMNKDEALLYIEKLYNFFVYGMKGTLNHNNNQNL